MFFKLTHTSSKSNARVGKVFTDRGKIDTPIFMPVGTLGSVKGVFQHDLDKKINAQIILSNNYHLYLRPGVDIVNKAGGLHKFINWDKPIVTDSGGYQIMSLSKLNKIELIVPDGQPIKWALNHFHKVNLKDRVYGPTLTLHVLEEAHRHSLNVFLYGSTEKTLRLFSNFDDQTCGKYQRPKKCHKSKRPETCFKKMSPTRLAN